MVMIVLPGIVWTTAADWLPEGTWAEGVVGVEVEMFDTAMRLARPICMVLNISLKLG